MEINHNHNKLNNITNNKNNNNNSRPQTKIIGTRLYS